MSDEEVITTRTQEIRLDRGIIVSRTLPGVETSLEDAMENGAANLRLAGGKKLPFLIDISEAGRISREARQYYARSEGAKTSILASALVTRTKTSRVLGSFFIGLNKPDAPIRLFEDADQARAWLETFLDRSTV